MEIIKLKKSFVISNELMDDSDFYLNLLKNSCINELRGVSGVFNLKTNEIISELGFLKNLTVIEVSFEAILSENINNKAFRRMNKYNILLELPSSNSSYRAIAKDIVVVKEIKL